MFGVIFGVCVIVLHCCRCSNLLRNFPFGFDIDDYPKLTKNPNKNFTILNLGDVQVDTRDDYIVSYNMITTLVERHHPDLITMTGDQIAGYNTSPEQWVAVAEKLFSFINNFGIPWAPVLGNHDIQGVDKIDTLLKMYTQQSNCLFQRGPLLDLDGDGNYVVNIFENDVLYKTLIFLDTHGNGNGFITPNQLSWYNWVVNGIESVNAEVQSILFFHIPLPEYIEGYEEWKNGGFNDSGFGERNEAECVSDINSGLFKLVFDNDNTKHIVVGHDHINSYSVMYQGVRLTYTLKTGTASYYTAHLQGGTIVGLNEEGVDIYHSFVV